MQRQRIVMLGLAAAVATAAVLIAVVRDGDDEPAARPPPTTLRTTTQVETTHVTVTIETRARPRLRTFAITVRGGSVRGGFRRFAVRRGERVAIVVRADARDEIHMHGYDLTASVAPGRPARITFRARLVGRFELELHNVGLHIAELEVRP